MNESNPEKAMYAVCVGILAVSLIALVLLSSTANTITGAVVYEKNSSGLIDDLVSYENVSFDNITQEMALNAILQAQRDMREMQLEGFGVNLVNDTLIEAKKYFEGSNYTALLQKVENIEAVERENAKKLLLAAQDAIGVPVNYRKVLENTKTISERREKAFEIADMIRASELRISDFSYQGVDVSQAEQILAEAADEFTKERYAAAESILEEVDKKLIELSAETTIVKTIYRAGRENIVVIVKENYKPLLLLLGSLLVIAILLYNRIMISVLKRRIKDMKVEKTVVVELMKKSQSDYFAKGEITKKIFEIKMKRLKEKLVEIKQKLPVAEALLDKRLKSKRVI